ncbi:MAG: zinc ABC transporter substrate-binding protein [Phycisphaerales bacterium]|nr:zinc ABC transporter substrate-binding protein [Phycisphaerales bacterium]
MAPMIALSTAWIAAAIAGQAVPVQPQVPSAPLKVVAANPVVTDILRSVGGGDIELVVVGAGGDPHHYEPTPADAKQIASADLVVQFGLGLDLALARLHASTESKGRLLVVADGLGTQTSGHTHDHEHDHAGEIHGGHDAPAANKSESSGVDPHIWHDPTKVQILNVRLCAALVALRPQLAETFGARSRALDAQLAQLNQWIKAQVQALAAAKRVIATTHDGLRYFADRYGLQVIGIEMMSGKISQTDPSPKELLKMVQALQAAKCAVVFGDSAHPSRVAATVAREANVRLVESLRLDGLAQPPAVEAGKAYLETMRANVKTIVEALNE